MTKRLMFAVLGAGVTAAGLSLFAVTPAFASIGGCVDSPENPTWILAGIGAVAAGVPWVRSVVRRRRGKREK